MEAKQERSNLLDELIIQARSIKGVELKRELFSQVELPEFLKVKLKVIDESGSALGTGSNLAQLREQFAYRKVRGRSLGMLRMDHPCRPSQRHPRRWRRSSSPLTDAHLEIGSDRISCHLLLYGILTIRDHCFILLLTS